MVSNMVFESRASLVLFNIIKELDNKVFLLPLNICPIVPLIFLKLKKPFEFVDISSDTLCIDEDIVISLVKKKLNKYGGIIYVRAYGYMSNQDSFFLELKNINSNFFIVDDRALSRIPLGLTDESFESDLILYSTGYAKYTELKVGGGIGILKDKYTYSSVKLDFSFNSEKKIFSKLKEKEAQGDFFKYIDSNWLGKKFEISNPMFYLDLIRKKTNEIDSIKKEINTIYESGLESIALPIEFQSWRYNILTTKKDSILKNLIDAGLFASSHYKPLNSIFKAVTHSKKNNSYIAGEVHSKIINLFNDNYYTHDKAAKTVDIINKVLKQ